MRVRSWLRRCSGLRSLEDYTIEDRRRMWPPAAPLQERHLCNARLVEHRLHILELLPQGGTCAEVGIFRCDFSAEILRRTHPSRLHLIDISRSSCELASQRFASELAAGTVVVHQGDSSTVLSEFPPGYFTWVYIDGDHSYDGAHKDLEASRTRIAPGGLILLDDYIFFSPSDFRKYGVVEATNDFCLAHDWEIVYFALHPRMYCDVALRRRS